MMGGHLFVLEVVDGVNPSSDAALVAEAYREHRPDLLHLLHHLRHPGCAALQGALFLLRGSGRDRRGEQDSVPGAEWEREPLDKPKVQLRQPGQRPHVPLRALLQGRLGQHHVPGPRRRWT